MVNTKVNLLGIELENPIIPARITEGSPSFFGSCLKKTDAAAKELAVCPEGKENSEGIGTIICNSLNVANGLGRCTIFLIILLLIIKDNNNATALVIPTFLVFLGIINRTVATIQIIPPFPKDVTKIIMLFKIGVLTDSCKNKRNPTSKFNNVSNIFYLPFCITKF